MTNAAANYEKIVNSLKKRSKGATAADVCSATALPLSVVHELLPKAADEYSGHLRVTESGEILYYFPNGFSSRYRGIGAFFRKIAGKSLSLLKKALSFLFKIWIMVMLVGYFLLFIALALASVIISIAVRRGSNDDSGGGFIGFGLFDLLIRLWFYSEFTRIGNHNDDYFSNYGGRVRNKRQMQKQTRPMHKSIFSFVFGEEDPNKNWKEQQDRAIIVFIQGNKGVISLAEYMAFTGENSLEAEKNILSFCSKFSGSPEITEEGTIVYRFKELLMHAPSVKYKELISPVQRLKTFSDNSKKMNIGLIAVNAVNLIFGSYFLYQSASAGQLIAGSYEGVSYLYAFTHVLISLITDAPHVFIGAVLGLVPFLFSLFFWLIPAARYFLEKKDNEEIKLKNFKRFSFNKILSNPFKITTDSFINQADECRPANLFAAGERVIKDMGAVSNSEIESVNGRMIYSFPELEKEKQALEKYRASIDVSAYSPGKTVFDSNDRVV